MPVLELLHEPSTSPPPVEVPVQVDETAGERSDRIYYDVAPYDADTGLSHLIAPPEEFLKPKSPFNTWHHRQGSEAMLLKMGEIGIGLRKSCIQLSRDIDHNFGPESFHGMTGLPFLPKRKSAQVSLIVMNAVTSITDMVFDPRRDGPRPITEEERQRLFNSGEVVVQSDEAVRRALTEFTIRRGIHYLEKEEIRRFKDTRTIKSRLRVVNAAMGRVLPIVFKPVDERYQVAREKGFTPETAPECAAEVARQYIYDEPERASIFLKYFNNRFELDIEEIQSTLT